LNTMVNTNADGTQSQSVPDWVKWTLAIALVGAGIFGNWYFQEQSILSRVLALVGLALFAGFVAFQTQRGRALWALLREARAEIRRVVWPTRQETTQTTFIVLALVLVFALILWGLDSLLSWSVSTVIG
jgi:preprotein translocase subunit SecE